MVLGNSVPCCKEPLLDRIGEDHYREHINPVAGEIWKGKSCPMCQTGNWIVQDNCFQITQFNPAGFVIDGSVIPIIPVICNNCSNTLLINAILAGVIIPQEKTSSEQNRDISSDIVKD